MSARDVAYTDLQCAFILLLI